MGQVLASLEEGKQRRRYFDKYEKDDRHPEEFDHELDREGYSGWIWRAYPDIARAYLTGDMEKFNALIAPEKKDRFGFDSDKYNTNKVDDLILFALEISEENEHIYRHGEQDESDPFVTVKVMKFGDSKEQENSESEAELSAEEEIQSDDANPVDEPVFSDIDPETAELSEQPNVLLTNKSNEEVAYEIIAAILARANDNPRCFNPDNMLSMAVDRDPFLVYKLLCLEMDIHPASALPKVDYKGRDGDEQYAAIKVLLLADRRIHDVNIHAVTWAAYQGDLEKLELLLKDPALVISEDAELALYWTVKGLQLNTFKRLLQDQRFNNPEILALFLEKKVLQQDSAIPIVEHLLEATHFDQRVFSKVLVNAAYGKAIGLMTYLLETPKYEQLVRNVDQDTMQEIFMWAITCSTHPKSRAELCHLLNKYLFLENKSEYISSMVPGQTHYIDPYLQYLIVNEREMLDLIRQFSDEGRLTTLHSRGDAPFSTRMVWVIEDKIREDGHPIGSFDNAILRLFDLVPKPPEAQSWEYVIDIFDKANEISSLDTLLKLAERLKSWTNYDHYQRILVHTLGDKYHQHISPEIQQQKIDAFMIALDLVNNPTPVEKSYSWSSYGIDGHLVESLKLMSPPALDQLLAESEAKGNQLLSNQLHKIKGDLSADQLLKDSQVQLLLYQARMERWKRDMDEEETLISAGKLTIESSDEADVDSVEQSEEEAENSKGSDFSRVSF
ncbi:MAG: hypothetical protein RLZ35_1148 [Pseudomonadota bacterium]